MSLLLKAREGKISHMFFIEEFESKESLDAYWNNHEFDQIYNHHLERTSRLGSEDIFRCKFYSKSGFSQCRMQAKVSFPGFDCSAKLFLTDASHTHERLNVLESEERITKFTWRGHPEATEIVLNGLKHNDFPSQIMMSLHEFGVSPLPTYEQLNNKLNYLRKSANIHGDITTSGELEEAIKKHSDIPDDDDIHKPFINAYKIEILPCGLKARFWISITTKNLLKRLKENPSKVFQIDGTYKLIWIPEKSKEGWCVQVHGTSNHINEFFPSGLIITSDETGQTYKEIFEKLDITIEFFMADGATALTNAKKEIWKPRDDCIKVLEDGVEVDLQRGMCYPHVQRNLQKKLKALPDYEKELLDDIKHIQLAANRKEFDEVNLMFYVKWLSVANDKIDEFIGYYHHQWVNSTESNWFAGAGPIDHNNGLEATNKDIKKTKILRDKQKLGAFLTNALSICESWSLKDDSRLYCNKNNLVSLDEQTKGYQFLMKNQNKIKYLRGKYFVLSEKASATDDIKTELKKYLNRFDDTFENWKRVKSVLYELTEDGDFFKCSCPYGMKKYFCKHAIGLSIKLKNFQIPDNAKSVPLAEKRKRGRPVKNKGWWSRE